MRQMMDKMRTEIMDKFNTIVKETVKREITAALEVLENKLISQGLTIADLERSANDHDSKITEL